MNRINKIFLALVLLFNLAIRLFGLGMSPAQVNWDEASLGVNAKCLGENGRDEYGNFLPIYLRSFNDYKAGLYSYLSILPIKIFGLNQFSIRLVSALAGVISLWGIYKILGFYIKNDRVKIIGILLIGVGPLRWHYSRVALESNLAATFIIWSWFWLLKKRYWQMILMDILAIFSYHSARIMIPALLLLICFDPIKFLITKRIKFKRKWVLMTVIMILFVLGLSLIFGEGLNRLGSESLFRLWPFVPRKVGGTVYYLGFYLSGHLLSMVNPNSWVAMNYDWFKNSISYIAQNGIMSLTLSCLFLIGIFSKINWKNYKYRWLIYLVLTGVLPVALTWNWFYPLRSFNSLLFFEIIAIIGLEKIWNKRLLMAIIMTFFVGEFFYTINNELNYSYFRNYFGYQATGIEEISKYLKNKNYNEIIVNTKQENAYIFYEFYGDVDCLTIQTVKENKSAGFGKISFRKIDWENDLKKSKSALVSEETSKEYLAKEAEKKVTFIKSPLKSYQASMIIETD